MTLKKNLSFYFAFLVMLTTYAQESMEPTISYVGQGKIILESGETKTGKVFFYPNSPTKVRIVEEGMEDNDKLKVQDVVSFSIEDKQWAKVVNKGAVGASPLYFMEKLTPSDRFLQVYKYEQQNSFGTDQGFLVVRQYYAGIESWEEVFSVGSLKFNPFHKKGSRIFEGCPELANKIAKKEDNYKLPLVSTDIMKANVFMAISEEYHNCQ